MTDLSFDAVGVGGGWGHALGTRMCVVMGGRIRVISHVLHYSCLLPLVYGDAERENEAFNYRLPTGDSSLVGSYYIRLILPPRDLSAILYDAPNLIRRFNPNPKIKTPFTRYLKVV